MCRAGGYHSRVPCRGTVLNITVFGSGYVGLVQAAVLADSGNHVICVDVNAGRVEALSRAEIPIYEPGLEGLIRRNLDEGRLEFTTDAAKSVAHAELQFIAVGTPSDEDGGADLQYVKNVARTIAQLMEDRKTIVTKSTVPVGTAELLSDLIAEELAGRDLAGLSYDVVSNPEFLKEGSAISDCVRPDRIIIGTLSNQAEALLREVYTPFNRNHEKIMVMDVRSAEMTKYVANCMLAAKISFMNEMALLAECIGADIESVRLGVGSDPRLGYHFMYAGAGYGGSCFPKDVRALIHTAGSYGVDAEILKAIESRNEQQKDRLFDKIRQYFGGELSGRTIAVWGLAFKPNTDDMREAPSRNLMEALWRAGACVRAHDPVAMEECRRIYGERSDLVLCDSQMSAIDDADALVVVTEWQAFKSPPFDEIRSRMKNAAIFDGRNIYNPQTVRSHGFYYSGVGRT